LKMETLPTISSRETGNIPIILAEHFFFFWGCHGGEYEDGCPLTHSQDPEGPLKGHFL
jgi:hypothetical protein